MKITNIKHSNIWSGLKIAVITNGIFVVVSMILSNDAFADFIFNPIWIFFLVAASSGGFWIVRRKNKK